VWETREARKEVSHSWFASPYLFSLLIPNIQNTLGHAVSTSLVCKNKPQRYQPEVVLCCNPMPFACRTSLACKSELYTTTTSLAPKSEPEVDLWCIFMPFACLPPPSHATARRRWIFVTFSEPSLTSQGRTAVSVDTRTALARSLGYFRSHTRTTPSRQRIAADVAQCVFLISQLSPVDVWNSLLTYLNTVAGSNRSRRKAGEVNDDLVKLCTRLKPNATLPLSLGSLSPAFVKLPTPHVESNVPVAVISTRLSTRPRPPLPMVRVNLC
jgi:hypothetical protein